jgi:hypothetical protein
MTARLEAQFLIKRYDNMTVPVRACQGFSCTSIDLIDAHIIPRGFARDMMRASGYNMLASMDKAHKTQHGIFDPNILCANCDGIIGAFDNYAIEVCRSFQKKHREFDDRFLMLDVDGDKLAKFALSVLWRASISNRPEFKKIDLGPYSDLAKEVIFGSKTLKDFPEYELMLLRFESPRINVEGLYTSPVRMTNVGINVWGFTLCGFRFMAKMDKRQWPRIPIGLRKEMVVNGNDKLYGFRGPYEGSTEHLTSLQMAGAHLIRHRKRDANGKG